MGNRRFEMHEYRQIITRMRLGDSDRQISQYKLMGRNKAAKLRKAAKLHGWLDTELKLPGTQRGTSMILCFTVKIIVIKQSKRMKS